MKRKRSLCLAAAFVIAAALANGLAQPPPPAPAPAAAQTGGAGPTDPRELETWFEGLLGGLSDHTEPLSLGLVVVKDGRVVFSKGRGYADDEGLRPVVPDESIFRAASVSKLVTATAVLQLAEQGRLALDADVNTYLKGFKVRNDYPEPVTLRRLLTHTSGIDERLIGHFVRNPSERLSLGEYFSRHTPVVTRPPGRYVIYSNHGMALAGHLVEVASGLPFEEYVERNIFGPLDMKSSSFRQPYPPQLAPRVVPSGADEGASLLPPSSSMISTVTDMSHFMLMHLSGGSYEGRRILSEESVREMHRQQFSPRADVPGVGLGFFENYTNGRHGLFHTGLSGHQSVLYLLPEENLGIYLVQSSRQGGGYQVLRERFVRAFLDKFYPATRHAEPARLPEGGGSVARVKGLYRPQLLPRARVEGAGDMAMDTLLLAGEDGTLNLLYPPYGLLKRLQLREVEPLLFKSAEGFYLSFREDERGNVRQMFLSGSLSDPISFERLSWYESGTLHLLIGAALASVFLSFPLVSAAGYALRLWPRWRGARPDAPRGEFKVAWYAALAVSLLLMSSPALLAAWFFLSDPSSLPYGVESVLKLSLGVVLGAALLGLSLPAFAFVAWRRGRWTRGRRIYYSAVALAAVILLPYLYHWNLLGLRL